MVNFFPSGVKARMRRINDDNLPEDAFIQEELPAPDGMGGQIFIWKDINEDPVPARIGVPVDPDLENIGDQSMTIIVYPIVFTKDFTIKSDQRIRIGSRFFEPIGTGMPRTNAVMSKYLCKEITSA